MVIKNFLVRKLIGWSTLFASAVCVMVAMFRLKSVNISDHGIQEYFGQELVRWSTLFALAGGVMVAMLRLKSVTISDHGNQ